MKILIVRKRKLGKTSCEGIANASKTGISVVRNDKMNNSDFEGVSMAIRWGCTSTIPIKNVLNTSNSIHIVSDKSGFRKLLCSQEDTKENTPYTVFTVEDAFDEIISGHTLFVRPKTHSQGKNVYVVDNRDDFIEAMVKCGDGWYASRYINKVAEYRVFVLRGKVVWVASKTPANPKAYAWNVAQGGRFDNVKWGDWNLNVCKVAIRAMYHSGLDFGGVDVMVDNTGKPYIIEINSAPSQTSPYRQSCVAKAFDYVVMNGKDWIESVKEVSSWKDYIHPGVYEKGTQ